MTYLAKSNFLTCVKVEIIDGERHTGHYMNDWDLLRRVMWCRALPAPSLLELRLWSDLINDAIMFKRAKLLK